MVGASGTEHRRAEFRRLDLPRRHAIGLMFSGSVELGEQLGVMFPELQKSEDAFSSITHYTRASHRHTLMDILRRRPNDESTVEFFVMYVASNDLSDWRQGPQKLLHSPEVLERLQLLPGPHSLRCTTNFIFPEEAALTLWFPLPTRLSSDPDGSPTYEVRGIEGTRINASEPTSTDFSFDMRRRGDGRVEVEIRFSLLSDIYERLPAELLGIAAKHANSLVCK